MILLFEKSSLSGLTQPGFKPHHRFVLSATASIALLVLGAALLTWEFLRPGTVVPGTLGGVGVITALWLLPWTQLSAAIFLGGVACVLLQTFHKLRWLPAIGAVGAWGSLPGAFQASSLLIVPIAAETLVLVVLFRLAARARASKLSVE
ncbi:MAG: hypothetical protein WKF37_15235 [Bryobacteraceae bacterium]